MEDALNVPAVMIVLYTKSTSSEVSGFEPDVTLTMSRNLKRLSPGLILSGEYP